MIKSLNEQDVYDFLLEQYFVSYMWLFGHFYSSFIILDQIFKAWGCICSSEDVETASKCWSHRKRRGLKKLIVGAEETLNILFDIYYAAYLECIIVGVQWRAQWNSSTSFRAQC